MGGEEGSAVACCCGAPHAAAYALDAAAPSSSPSFCQPLSPPLPLQECRISGKAGFSTELTYGGGEFPLSIESMPWTGWFSGLNDPNAP